MFSSRATASIALFLQNDEYFLPVLRLLVRQIEMMHKKGLKLEYVSLRVDVDERGDYVAYAKLDGADRTVTGNLKGKNELEVVKWLLHRLVDAFQARVKKHRLTFE
ncbi:MAG: hypothetical protein IMW88_02545 [Thermoflavifilum sp.]|uniref:hypothetical protein n=1 Tax=Thermoflavifilum sp. TaxID=1968839 RepID=UPI0018A62141|nr:hypothetical protein [Thermoflavifilum sp.]QOR76453.1 MAG: hypothetical protein IMW88_02545 [Thermoflavifilum sp.]